MPTPHSKTLILSLEPSQHYPEQSRAATELVPGLREALSTREGPEVAFETLPFLWEAAAEKARFAVAEHEPSFVFLLTNEPNNLEILLHRYAGPHYEVDFPDNHGSKGAAPDLEGLPCISKSEVFQLHNAWSDQAPKVAGTEASLAHVTMAMSGSGGVEGETFRALLEAYGDEPIVIARLGLPPIAPQHEGLKPETLIRTLTFLMEHEYQLQ